MTARVIYIGDKLMANGFVLSGAQIYTPQAKPDAIWDSFSKACEEADLIVISEAYAQLITEKLARFKRKTPIPPVLSLPETGKQISPARATIRAAKSSLGIAQ